MKTKTEAAVLAELKKYGKRWDWDGVDCTWTGKDADLETHGYQGCKLIRIDKGVATVEVHRRNIMRKLGLHTVAELTRHAIRTGITAL